MDHSDALPPDSDGGLPPCLAGGCDHQCSVRRLPAALSEVVRTLGRLQHPAAITENQAARLTQVGSYADLGVPGGPFRVEAGRVSLRVDPDALTNAMFIEPQHPASDEASVPELRLCGADGGPVHRCLPLLPPDRVAIETLAQLDPQPGRGSRLGAWPSSAAGGSEVPDQLQRIDDLLTWSTARTPFLPHQHIEPGALVDVIEHACSIGLPLGIAVFSDAVMHAVQDRVQSVAHAKGVMAVGAEDAILELRPAAVQHCLLLRLHGPHGPTSSLELYDELDRRVAVISQFGIVERGAHDGWEQLAGSLPELV